MDEDVSALSSLCLSQSQQLNYTTTNPFCLPSALHLWVPLSLYLLGALRACALYSPLRRN
jgi:hypothetical protein